jgi:hypothetical protein
MRRQAKMKVINRNSLQHVELIGRGIQKAVGKDGFDKSSKMTIGFARYANEYGRMEPHRHAEEVLYIINAKKGWIRSGSARDKLGERIPFVPRTLVHFAEMEWHAFEFDDDGFVDLIFIYGQVDNIRPEDANA